MALGVGGGLTFIAVASSAAIAQPPAPTPPGPPNAAAPAPQPRPAERLRGRVATDSGRPIAGAQVYVTRGPDRLVEQATTGADGRWEVRFAPGTGDYLVYVAAPGRQPLRRRVTRGAPGFPATDAPDSVYVVDAALAPVEVPTLAAVEVRERRTRPERPYPPNATAPSGPGAAERQVDDLIGSVAPEQAGDLAALAATTPGVTVTPRGLVALGATPEQNAITLGGLQFTGNALPRDVRTVTRVVTSTYDPSRGWFGGAQTAVELSPGTQYQWARGHLTLDAPALQATDAAGARLGQQVAGLQGSYGREGGLRADRLTYSLAVQGARRAQDAVTLLDADADALRAAGLDPAAAARVRAALAAARVPTTVADAPGGFDSTWRGPRTTEQLSFAGRLGTPVFDYRTFQTPRRVVGLTAYGTWQRNAALGLDPTAVLTRGGEAARGTLGVQGSYSRYVGRRDWLLELRTGLSGADQRRTPYLALPGAQVLVGADTASGPSGSGVPGGTGVTGDAPFTPGLVPVAFGGNGAFTGRQRTWLWETQGALSLLAPGNPAHQLTLTGDVRLDGLDETPVADVFGSYAFASLADLAADRPARFTRTLAVPPLRARVWNGFLALGDEWRVRPGLRVLAGVRAEANAYATRPAANPALERALGVRTDVVPNTVGLSPRLGFTWRRTVNQDGMAITKFGDVRLPGLTMLRGGIGEFRSLLGPELVAPRVAATGLPGAVLQLLCTGAAVPRPAWDAWAAGAPLPTACAGGAPSALTDAAPGVIALAPDYTAPRSWRANLAWSTVRAGAWVQLEGTWALTLDQPGQVDANFAGTPRFTAAGEGRPVFVSPAGIDVATGAVSPVEARRTNAFGSVIVGRADLRGVARQLVLTVAPVDPNTRRWWGTGSYVLGDVREQTYGFTGGTAGDPRVREWARGDADVRHQLLVQGGVTARAVTLTLFGRLQSGLPFTPVVGSDVNGDGLANDRAYVPNVSAAAAPAGPDAALATQLGALLAEAPAATRDCLTRVAGAAGITGGIAGRNVCRGPWTATLNARLTVDGRAVGLGPRARVGLNLTNPLAGLDRLLHGERLRGWGAPALPDPVLLQVRGFDPAAGRFAYAVNPRFGDARPQATALRAPFRVTIDVSLDLARPMPVQQMEKWLGPGRGGRPGPRLTADELRARYVRSSPEPYGAILRQADSLLLTRAQVTTLQQAQTRWRASLDSAWRPLAAELAALGDGFDARTVSRRQDAVAYTVWELARRDVQATLPNVLNAAQLQILPGGAAGLYRAKDSRRSGYFFF